MKKSIVAIFIALTGFLPAQKAEKIYRIVRQPREHNFYVQQIPLWKKETENKPKDPTAWQNYFYAVRYANMSDPTGRKPEMVKLMKEIMTAMEKNVPKSKEFLYCKSMNIETKVGKNNAENLALIEKGLQLDPGDPDFLESRVLYAQVHDEQEKLKDLCTRLLNTHIYDIALLEYNYNSLMSVEKNAILFTGGDNDTFVAWVLQQAKGVRTDVTVINIPLAVAEPEYLKRLLKGKNISLPDALAAKAGTMEEKIFIKELVLEINKKYAAVPVFFALTAEIESVFDDSLYCTGLAYQFSTSQIDNISKLKKNVETKFHLDYLKDGLMENNPVSKELNERCKANYNLPFGMLYKHYKNLNEPNPRLEFYYEVLMENAAKMGNEKETKEYLHSNKGND